MEIASTLKSGIDFIPTFIGWIRTAIEKLTESLNLPSDSNMFMFMLIGLVLAYFWVRQFVTYSIFTKVSTILNWLLLGLLLYILFVYI